MIPILTDFWKWMSPFKLGNQSSDPATDSSVAQIYAKTTGGVITPYFKDSGGTVTKIGAGVETGTWSADLGPSGTAARADNTTYQNTSGTKRRVFIGYISDAVAGHDLGVSVNCDSFTPPTTMIFECQIGITPTINQHQISAYFEVPNNWYYKSVIASTGTTINVWRELDE